ncbi:hypothetical protein PLICRDRAFT_566420 [Plicaturopsis crispa FD-325 SS-3]|nr:hypothetical protein PLICRDRAFT_566420 [Plicaturopsis crispa FD-325 SS-3]
MLRTQNNDVHYNTLECQWQGGARGWISDPCLGLCPLPLQPPRPHSVQLGSPFSRPRLHRLAHVPLQVAVIAPQLDMTRPRLIGRFRPLTHLLQLRPEKARRADAYYVDRTGRTGRYIEQPALITMTATPAVCTSTVVFRDHKNASDSGLD